MGIPLRFRLLATAALLAACAGAPARPALEADDLRELRSQLQAQSAVIAQQQRRIEELEVKLAALAARTQAAPTHAAPARVEPRPPPPTPNTARPTTRSTSPGSCARSAATAAARCSSSRRSR